jgi:hypothetical protein
VYLQFFSQLEKVHVADAHEQVQMLVSVVKMATMLGKCITEDQRSVMHFLWAKQLNTK